jgi:hypothetical protein
MIVRYYAYCPYYLNRHFDNLLNLKMFFKTIYSHLMLKNNRLERSSTILWHGKLER